MTPGDVAALLRLPAVEAAPPRDRQCPWVGARLHLRAPEEDLWHEIGHAIVAPRRWWSDDGWGQGVPYDYPPRSAGWPEGNARIVGTEAQASAVGLWLYWQATADEGAVESVAKEHCWPTLADALFYANDIDGEVGRRVAHRMRRIEEAFCNA